MDNSFPIIHWNDDFNTGVQEIDEQHIILVNILNEASEKLTADSSQAAIQKITQHLLAYALYHFEEEEALMLQYAYEEASEESMQKHLTSHRQFSQQVLDIREQLHAGKKIEVDDLLTFLNQWLVGHILNTDQALGRWILARRGQSPDT